MRLRCGMKPSDLDSMSHCFMMAVVMMKNTRVDDGFQCTVRHLHPEIFQPQTEYFTAIFHCAQECPNRMRSSSSACNPLYHLKCAVRRRQRRRLAKLLQKLFFCHCCGFLQQASYFTIENMHHELKKLCNNLYLLTKTNFQFAVNQNS